MSMSDAEWAVALEALREDIVYTHRGISMVEADGVSEAIRRLDAAVAERNALEVQLAARFDEEGWEAAIDHAHGVGQQGAMDDLERVEAENVSLRASLDAMFAAHTALKAECSALKARLVVLRDAAREFQNRALDVRCPDTKGSYYDLANRALSAVLTEEDKCCP